MAPHGGRRAPADGTSSGAATQKVNDLHTAELATELAEGLHASYVINIALDRNQLDLNRVSQVTARARWFLALLERLLGDILERHARAEVLFVHGWNVLQPKCDLGIGRRLADPREAVAHAEELTASPGYVAGRLTRLRELCAAQGIATRWGERYPARHHNNVLQLFRRGPLPRTPAAQLAAWSAAGRVDAVQLELGVPLRWPGAHRTAFLRAATAAFSGPAERIPAARQVAARRARGTRAPLSMPAALQLYDPRAGIGLAARIDQGSTHGPISGRLLLFEGADRVALFTGDDPHAVALSGGGPHFTAAAPGFRLTFDGAVLVTDDGRLYVDLEAAFAAARLCAMRVELRFRPTRTAALGAVTGRIEIDGVRHTIDTCAFAHQPFPQRATGPWRSHVAVIAAFAPDHGVRARHESPGAGILQESAAGDERVEPLPEAAVWFDGDRHTPRRILLTPARSVPIRVEPLTRMSVLRPTPPRGQARLTFGAARVSQSTREGFGFYEYARLL